MILTTLVNDGNFVMNIWDKLLEHFKVIITETRCDAEKLQYKYDFIGKSCSLSFHS